MIKIQSFKNHLKINKNYLKIMEIHTSAKIQQTFFYTKKPVKLKK